MAGIGLLMAELCSLNGTAQAALGLTNVTPTTTIVANGCSVSQASQEQTVDLGNWASKQFATTREISTAKRFVINLENCGSAATCVQVMFSGTANHNDSTLLALNSARSATNKSIAMLDKDRIRIPLGQNSERYSFTSSASSASRVFNSQYVSIGCSVTPGSASGTPHFRSTTSSAVSDNRCAVSGTAQRFL
ncbi:fimbrial protein [Lonsdalea quercina]|uniref:fimbrial protein n=1 Tax=Lonsdalea quercina TaxID=71657 RepID=UPI003976B226